MVEKIEKLRIPDDDMPGWIQTLREGGFNDEEIDFIMSNLNKTYDRLKKNEFIEQELRRMEEEIKNRRGFGLNIDERRALRESIESRFK